MTNGCLVEYVWLAMHPNLWSEDSPANKNFPLYPMQTYTRWYLAGYSYKTFEFGIQNANSLLQFHIGYRPDEILTSGQRGMN